MKKLLLALLAILILTVPVYAGNKTLRFGWQQTLPEPNDLAGWKLYKSFTAGGPYELQETIPYTAPSTEYTSQTTLILEDNKEHTLYFVITAYDTSNNESAYSNEVSARIDFLKPGVPINFTVTVVTGP